MAKTLYINSFLSQIKKNELVNALTVAARERHYEVVTLRGNKPPPKIDKSDILIIWNRHLHQDHLARFFEANKAQVWLFENPYIRVPNKDYYSFGLGYHNNIHFAPKQLDNGERFRSFGREIKPWKKSGKNIIICTQAKEFNISGLGYENHKQPVFWDEKICRDIKERLELPDKKIVFRTHPKSYEKFKRPQALPTYVKLSSGYDKPLIDDLKDAYCLVVYTSNSATEGLLEGVPVCVMGPTVFLKDACNVSLMHLNGLRYYDNREELFHRLAWAQYDVDEIKKGILFDTLVQK